MNEPEWINLAREEIARATHARLEGNEGKARVCARRAAGYIVEEYFERNGYQSPGSSAIFRLRLLDSLPGIPLQAKEIVNHLLIHVTPDHKLPVDVDLIQETHTFAELILEITI
jgi:hypothetical protein